MIDEITDEITDDAPPGDEGPSSVSSQCSFETARRNAKIEELRQQAKALYAKYEKSKADADSLLEEYKKLMSEANKAFEEYNRIMKEAMEEALKAIEHK